ncbi:disease resistance protein At4g27190-like isoform X2 [Euphorbia lathyris]|uniref:disease resistance protein At4g27190-like isoform X2 n=1 Tax=Euphorbia lathyris TaxID=212925 RepID=UPI0033138F62
MQEEKKQELRSTWNWNLDFILGKDEEVRLCYWLCCLFPRSFDIPVEDLVIYGMGLELFKDVDSLFQSRDRVCTFLDELKYDNLLLDGEEDDYGNKCVKMVYDVPNFLISIVSKYNLEVNCETVMKTWPETDRYKGCIAISLEMKEISEQPLNLECPQLRLLQLKYRKQVPIDFFEGMKELRVLCLDIPSVLPQSLHVLKQLRALHVKVLKWEDLSEIGRLKNLEILSISTISLTDIPEEMGLLCNLRLLDLRKMNIAHLSQGVLSRMLKLEELYLPLSFSRWGCRPKVEHDYDDWESGDEYDYDIGGEKINAGLSEIVSLPITTLQITVPNASILPVESSVFKKLTRFKILIKSNLRYRPFCKSSMNELQLRGDVSDIKASGICGLLHKTEELNLTKVRNLKNVMNQLEDGDYPDLKKIIITECDDLEYIVDMKPNSCARFSNLESLHLSMLSNLKEIWHGIWPTFPWFENLKQINVRFCHKLKYVFPLSIWPNSGLRQLQSVEIHQCNDLEGIFYRDQMDDKTQAVYFPAELYLYSLPKLAGFLVEKDNMLDGIHDDQSSNKDTATVTWKVGSNSPRRKITAKEHTPTPRSIMRGVQLITRVVVEQFSNTEDALLKDEHSEMYYASSSELMEKRLGSLKKLRIAFCEALKVIFSLKEYHATNGVLSSLEELELYGLQNLVHIWFQIPQKEIMAFQLQVLVLSECHNLYLFSASVAKLLVKLQKMHITHCEKMTEIVSMDDEIVQGILVKKIVFPQLKVLELQCMPNLRNFYGGMSIIELPSLEILKLNQCNRMETFSYWSPRTPMLDEIQINDSRYSVTEDLNAAINAMVFTGREKEDKEGQEKSYFRIPWPSLLRL